MAFYRSVGEIPPKRHTVFRQLDGTLYAEELMGEEGFSSDSSLLYHRGIPSAMSDAHDWALPDLTTVPNHPLRPLHLRLPDLFAGHHPPEYDLVTGRILVLGNADVRISYVVGSRTSPLYRNATGDECVYIESGSGTVETVFGALTFRDRDYVIIPRATVHRWLPDGVVKAYAIEASSHIGPPKRYLSKYGQLLEHSPYCERDLHGPTEPLLAEGTDVPIYTKHRGHGPSGIVGSIVVASTHPFDVVGLGRLPLPVHVQRRRLRADHRPGPPAAAGAPGVRGQQLRGLQLRAAQGRLPPAGHPGALLPLQRRLRRGDVLLRRRLRGPQGLRHRHRLHHPAPGRAQPRPAAGCRRGGHRQALLRRARRHGGHVPTAGAGAGSAGQRRRPVRRVVGSAAEPTHRSGDGNAPLTGDTPRDTRRERRERRVPSEREADPGQVLRRGPQLLGQLGIAGLGGPTDQLGEPARLGEAAGPHVPPAGQVLGRGEQRRPRTLAADCPITLVTIIVARSAQALPLWPCRLVRAKPGCAAARDVRSGRGQPPLQLQHEQQIGQLRLPVRRPLLVRPPLPVEVGQVDLAHPVGAGADADDPVGELWQQQVGQGEVAEVVGAELELEALGGPAQRHRHHPGVVDQQVDRPRPGPGEGADGAQIGEVERPDLGQTASRPTASAAFVGLRTARTTRAPLSASTFAAAKPMPLVAPVMTTVRPDC